MKEQFIEIFNDHIKRPGACLLYTSRRNNFRHTVEVTVRVADRDNLDGGPQIFYYLSRPMTEAEIFEANQFTGSWEEK